MILQEAVLVRGIGSRDTRTAFDDVMKIKFTKLEGMGKEYEGESCVRICIMQKKSWRY